MADLSLGMSGAAVAALQEALQALRLYIPPAEITRRVFGPATRQALVLFQTKHRLPTTGTLDERTGSALLAATDAKPASNSVTNTAKLPASTTTRSGTPAPATGIARPGRTSTTAAMGASPSRAAGSTGARSVMGSTGSTSPVGSKPTASLRTNTTPARKISTAGNAPAASVAQPAPTNPALSELAPALGTGAAAFFAKLSAHGINTLTDVRRAGGLARIAGSSDAAMVRLVEAHADLARVSANASANATLISSGYDSTLEIAKASLSGFVQTAAPILGITTAARVHTEATALYRTLDQIVTAARIDATNGTPTGLSSQVNALLDPYDKQMCECSDCYSAPGPGAYLADLLAYILQRLKDRGQAITLQFLIDTFHQPFADFPVDCEAMDQQVRQVRICSEVLRSYLQTHPPTQVQAALLASAESDYLLATYSALLAGLGTTYEEIRLARFADRATRNALADRLGLTIDPYGSGRPDPLDRLLLDLPTSEAALERLFGPADTMRNPLSDGPTVGDTNGLILRWNLSGTEWGRNTDPDGTIYVTLANTQSTKTFQVSLYKDSGRVDPYLVGSSGSVAVSGGGLPSSIGIYAANSSGLGGTFYIASPTSNSSIALGAVPLLTSWQLQTLRVEWQAEDHPVDMFVDGMNATPLASLPIPIPFNLRPVMRYDPGMQFLFFGNLEQGVMSTEVLAQLLSLSTDAAYTAAIKTLYVGSQRFPVIDPDLVGPDDFRVPVPKTRPSDPDQPFDLWLRRRNWVDTNLISLASITRTVQGGVVPDINGTLAAMSQPWTYGATSVVPWLAGTPVSSFETLWENLAEGVDVDATVLRLSADLGLTIDGFNRLMDIWHQDRAAAVDSRNPVVTADAWRELYSVLVQSAKARFFPDWRAEEKVLSLIPYTISFFGSDTFVVSLREPVTGDWPPGGGWPPLGTAVQPLIDPNIVGVTDLPEPTAGVQALQLWEGRSTQIAAYTDAIRAAREGSPSPGGTEAALKLALGDPLPADLDQLARDLLSPDPTVVANATAVIQTKLFMSVDAFNRLMMVRAMDQDVNPAGWPTPALWIEFYTILTSAQTPRQAYPTWLTEESNLFAGTATWTPHKGYWLARKAALPRWRSSIDLRMQWHAALALRSSTPIIDPDLITTADLVNPFAGDPAFDLWQARTTWVASQLQQLQQPTSTPSTVSQVDAALLAAIGISGVDFVAIGQDGDAGTDISPRLAQLGLTNDAFNYLLGIRALIASNPNPTVLQSEWDAFWSILVQVLKQRRYAIWLLEEAGHIVGGQKILLGPDQFQFPTAPITDPIAPPPLLEWRATPAARQAWEDVLTSRIEQNSTVVQAVASLVDFVEGRTLTQLRDALVQATDAPGTDLPMKADWFTSNLMIDAQTGGCQKTTRIEQALETLQTIMNEIRDGQIGGFDIKLASAPVVMARGAGPDRIDVFVRGTDDALWHKWWDGTAGPSGVWQDWESLGGTITSAPTVVSPIANFLEVFAVGSNGTLYHREYDSGGRWSDWQQVGDPTFQLLFSPTAAAPEQGTMDLFAVGSDQGLWQLEANFLPNGWSWGPWVKVARTAPLPTGGIGSAPAARLTNTGNYDLFVRGGDGALWLAQQNTGGWTGWASEGGTLTSAPVVVAYFPDPFDVFVRGSDWAIYQKSHSLLGWQPWTRIGGFATQGPGASLAGSGRLDLFVAGGDGALWHTWRNGSWHGWEAANELSIDDTQGTFDEEWSWMGSYATWRAAILVFLYPENLLQPTLRKWRTPAFQTLVDDVSNNPTLTPAQAATEARKYASYFSDICSMNIELSRAGVVTQLHDPSGVPTNRLPLWYMLGSGGATNRIYWSTWDVSASPEYAQSFWDFVPGLAGQAVLELIDAVPYATAGNRRFLCLFARAQAAGTQVLLLTRYDLEAQTWDGSSTPLDLPEQTPSLEAVVVPNSAEQSPPVVRVRAASGQIYQNTLNADATYWATGGWDHLVWTPWTRIDANFAALQVTRPSQVSVVSRDSNSLDIFVTAADGSINWASYSTQTFGSPWTSFSPVDAGFIVPANAPLAAITWAPTSMELFVVGNDGKLYDSSWDLSSDTWQAWNPVTPALTFEPLTPITAIAPQPGYVRIFGVQQPSSTTQPFVPYTFWRDNGQWGDDNIPDGFDQTGNPAFFPTPLVPVGPADDGYHLFAVAWASQFVNYGAYEIANHDIIGNPGGWGQNPSSDWVARVRGSEPFGTTKALTINVLYRDAGAGMTHRWDGFVVGDDGKVNWNWRAEQTQNQWQTWTPISQDTVPVGSAITALSRSPTFIDLFVVRGDGGIWSNSWDDNRNGGSWSGWFRIGGSTDTALAESVVTAVAKNSNHIDLFIVGNNGGIYTASWDADPNVFWIQRPPLTLPANIRAYPAITAPLDVPERLSSDQLQQRRKLIKQAMEQIISDNPAGQLTNLTYLQEAYYFIPVYLAEQLQKQAQYTSALDWFRTVYDYSMPVTLRNIYYGFDLEASLAGTGPLRPGWLLDPLNPHSIAATRQYAYTRYTILSIVQCLLDYADTQFSYDTSESDAHARTLYMTALGLLGLPVFKPSNDECETLLIVLSGLPAGAQWRGALQFLRRELAKIDRVSILATAVPRIQQVLEGPGAWSNRLTAARALVSEARRQVPPRPALREMLSTDTAKLESLYSALLASPALDSTLTTVTRAAGRAFAGGIGGEAPAEPSGASLVSPLPGVMMLPNVSFTFCVPPNPLLDALRAHARNELYKLRNCMNIAGIQRQVDPYSAPTDAASGLPTIGAGGQISIPGAIAIQPTAYSYAFLIDRAQKLAQTATTMEAAMLSAFEKYYQELYTELEARQNLQVAIQTVQLQSLAVKQATDGVTLAQLQQQRAQTEIAHAQQLLNSDVAGREDTAIEFMQGEAVLQIASALASAAAAGSAFLGKDPAVASGLSDTANALSSTAASLGTFAAINQARASQEVQQIDWQYQLSSGQADFNIAGQQITIAQDQVAVANQQLNIAQLQATQKSDVVNFLANKFTNADLYGWMSNVLLGVYGYFLRQATAVARMAENQMAFERQETPPGFIKPDYWQPPSAGSSSTPANTQGLTGAERLTQDITQLDEYYLESDRRKLQLTKTLSLAQLYPLELQGLRDTGVMNFITPMRLFDQDFPGHHLRLIQKVTTSVIALIPPSQGIKATLATAGATRVVIGPEVFQTVVVRRDPQSIALTSPTNATGVFALDPQPNLLLPFQNLGVEAQWEFSMPKAANPFDYSTIADVLISIDYTALDSPDYRMQVLRALSDQTSAERPFSFRNDLADQWYDLHNPDQTATPMTVQFSVARTDFPANIDAIRIQQVLLYFSRADGATSELMVSALRFAEGGGTSAVGGAAKTVNGVISTRRGNATSWMPMIGRTPFGNWQLVLPNTEVLRNWFADDLIDDMLFVITYSARTPPYPPT